MIDSTINLEIRRYATLSDLIANWRRMLLFLGAYDDEILGVFRPEFPGVSLLLAILLEHYLSRWGITRDSDPLRRSPTHAAV
jgi:hypothetical protein